jgi:hypothetical protein
VYQKQTDASFNYWPSAYTYHFKTETPLSKLCDILVFHSAVIGVSRVLVVEVLFIGFDKGSIGFIYEG